MDYNRPYGNAYGYQIQNTMPAQLRYPNEADKAEIRRLMATAPFSNEHAMQVTRITE